MNTTEIIAKCKNGMRYFYYTFFNEKNIIKMIERKEEELENIEILKNALLEEIENEIMEELDEEYFRDEGSS